MRELTDAERSAFATKAAWLQRVTEIRAKDLEDDGEYDRDPAAAEAKLDEAVEDFVEMAIRELASETDLTEDEARDAWYSN